MPYKKWLLWMLYGVPLLVAGNQMLRSNLSDLTRWKGGGFGMYTEMYPENRSIWLVTESADSSLVVKIYPITLSERGKLDPYMREVYRQLRPEVRNLLHYPSGFNYNSKRMNTTRDLLWDRHKKLIGENPLVMRIEVQAVEFSLDDAKLESRLLVSKIL
jgi:hypothetical protein